MYIPKQFSITDLEKILAFIKKNSFATMISNNHQTPVATHIPIEVEYDDKGSFFLVGHISKANEQSEYLKQHNTVLVIFSSYNHYVSSTWYDHENVPTWNYLAIHVTGNAELIDGDDLLPYLSKQTDKYERSSENPLHLDTLSTDYLKSQLNGIVGIKINVTNIQAAYKLSQNRDPHNFNAIISELEKINSENSLGIASEMKKLRANV